MRIAFIYAHQHRLHFTIQIIGSEESIAVSGERLNVAELSSGGGGRKVQEADARNYLGMWVAGFDYPGADEFVEALGVAGIAHEDDPIHKSLIGPVFPVLLDTVTTL